MFSADIIPAVTLPRSKRQSFSYSIPDTLTDQIFVGSLVVIPFRSRNILGLVISTSQNPSPIKLKFISRIIDSHYFDQPWIDFLYWFSQYFGSSVSHGLQTILPRYVSKNFKSPNKKQQNDLVFSSINFDTINLNPIQNKILSVFKKKNIVVVQYQPELCDLSGIFKTHILKNEQILFLVPEIFASQQYYQYYRKVFGESLVTILHSDIKPSELQIRLNDIYNGSVKIIIGTRSSVFTRFNKLGLIVIDQEGSSSYKSWDQYPKYNAEDVALYLSESQSIKILLLSNILSVRSYYFCSQAKYGYLELDKNKPTKLSTEIISLAKEQEYGNYTLISKKLKTIIAKALDKHQKIILYLDNSSFYTLVRCADCFYIFICPNCSVSLRLQNKTSKLNTSEDQALVQGMSLKGGKLICNYCNYDTDIPLACPKCSGVNLRFFGIGTKRITHILKTYFPKVKILNMDRKTDFTTADYEAVDIIVSTQAILKLCFLQSKFQVSLVAMLNMDLIWSSPDFRCNEKIYYLVNILKNLAQDQFIVQTYQPQRPILQLSLKGNYDQFYKNEIQERQDFNYLPFFNLVKLGYKHKDQSVIKKEANDLYSKLVTLESDLMKVSPPHLAFRSKIKKQYQFEILLKLAVNINLDLKNKIMQIIPDKWTIDVNPV